MDTATIQIGNKDGKLSQHEWIQFYTQVDRLVSLVAEQVHFAGKSDSKGARQNACWVVAIGEDEVPTLERSLDSIRIHYRQDSIAITYGVTQFIGD
jgi:hypothetical protein